MATFKMILLSSMSKLNDCIHTYGMSAVVAFFACVFTFYVTWNIYCAEMAPQVDLTGGLLTGNLPQICEKFSSLSLKYLRRSFALCFTQI